MGNLMRASVNPTGLAASVAPPPVERNVEAACRRSDLFERRRSLMLQWGATRESSRFFASALMKPLEQLSRPARSAGRETGYAANHSLWAVRRWQRRRAKRPDNVPPRRRLGDREVADGFCQLRADEGQG